MSSIIQGKVAFVNHDKNYVMIEFDVAGKKKAINGVIDDKTQEELIKKGIIKKKHHFHIGDTVNFLSKLSDRGDKMVAYNIQYQYNTALDVLVNKAKTKNEFVGYLKEVDSNYFIKEADSYLFIPIKISPWQLKPNEHDLNELVYFSLADIEKKEKLIAILAKTKFIAEYHTALKLHKSNTAFEATVYKVGPHGVYVNVVDDKIQGKLPANETAKVGDKIKVTITYLSEYKIILASV
jgi:hypothetical protein